MDESYQQPPGTRDVVSRDPTLPQREDRNRA